MKTMIDCLMTDSLCKKVQGNYNKLVVVGSKLQAGGITPAAYKILLAEKSELSRVLGETCYECERAQRIKMARAEVKAANKVLSEALEALEAAVEKSEGIAIAIYERLIAEEPELEAVVKANPALLEHAIECDAEWIAHSELLDDLYEAVEEARQVLDKAKLVLTESL